MDQASAKYDDRGSRRGPPGLDDTVRQYAGIARRVAARFARQFSGGLRRQFREELETAALAGIWKAARQYDAGRGVEFATYAERLSYFAAMDWLRDSDHVSRLSRSRGDGPGLISLEVQLRSELPGGNEIRLGETLAEDAPPPESGEEGRDLIGYALRGLSPRDAEIVRLRFLRGLAMREVAERVGVGESRISQLLPGLLERMRRRLERIGF